MSEEHEAAQDGAAAEVLQAGARAALALLEHFVAEGHDCPRFIMSAKAILLASTYKAGCGFAVQHGNGVLLARLPCSGKAQCVDSFRHNRGWSAPCFMRLNGLSSGLTLGVQRADLLVGVMSDAALERIARGGQLALGAEASVCLLQGGSDRTAAIYDHDLAVCSLASGLMLDFSLSAGHLTVDEHRNALAYGPGVGAAALLGGEVALPEGCCALAAALGEAERRAFAGTFEPSTKSEAYFG